MEKKYVVLIEEYSPSDDEHYLKVNGLPFTKQELIELQKTIHPSAKEAWIIVPFFTLKDDLTTL